VSGDGTREPGDGTRERILRATLEVIAADGVGGITNRRVAAAAGVSLGSLTYHFSSQSELLRESLLTYVEDQTSRLEAIARELAARDPTLEQVSEEIERIVASGVEVRGEIAELELYLHAARDSELREAASRCFDAHERFAASALRAMGVEDAEAHAPVVVALMTGLAVRRLAGGGRTADGTSQALIAVVSGLVAGDPSPATTAA
jgi:AcrR family transcriptional regulator